MGVAVGVGAVGLVGVVAASGAVIGGAPSPTQTITAVAAATASQPCGRVKRAPKWRHVVWLVLENHGPDAAMNKKSAPYLSSLAGKCGLATNMWAVTHPSLPNYVAMTSGGTHGITDGGTPAKYSLASPSIFSQLGNNGWRVLAQSMPTKCHHANSGAYVVRHNPAVYFTNLAQACSTRDVPLAGTPNLSARFTLIVPDQQHNGHDVSVRTADNWLAAYVPKILSSRQYRAGKTALFITYDENEGHAAGANRVSTVVVSPSTRRGTSNSTHFTHYSLLRTTEAMLGLPGIGNARTAPQMRKAFRLAR